MVWRREARLRCHNWSHRIQVYRWEFHTLLFKERICLRDVRERRIRTERVAPLLDHPERLVPNNAADGALQNMRVQEKNKAKDVGEWVAEPPRRTVDMQGVSVFHVHSNTCKYSCTVCHCAHARRMGYAAWGMYFAVHELDHAFHERTLRNFEVKSVATVLDAGFQKQQCLDEGGWRRLQRQLLCKRSHSIFGPETRSTLGVDVRYPYPTLLLRPHNPTDRTHPLDPDTAVTHPVLFAC